MRVAVDRWLEVRSIRLSMASRRDGPGSPARAACADGGGNDST